MPDNLPEFSEQLLNWYYDHKRQLPWRETKSPYKVWLSEIILQQTRVDQGMPYYLNFVENYPDVHAPAAAPDDEVLKLWQGLGYYSRARNLHHTAKYISEELKGVFPQSYSELLKLKGVGPYTASAIASICFDQPRAVVDGNVFRVLARVFGMDADIGSTAGKKLFDELAQQLISQEKPGDYNQAIMEFGAVHCKPASPKCPDCIFSDKCEALKSDRVRELPVKLRKNKTRKRYISYLVLLAENDSTLLKKREEQDIWQQLYDFPSIESDKQLKALQVLDSKLLKELVEEDSLNGVFLHNEKPIVHKLSHQELHLNFWIVQVSGRPSSFLAAGEVGKYPVPVPVRNFLSEFEPFQ